LRPAAATRLAADLLTGAVSDDGRVAPQADRGPGEKEREERKDEGADERSTSAGTSAREKTGDDEEPKRVERKESADAAGHERESSTHYGLL